MAKNGLGLGLLAKELDSSRRAAVALMAKMTRASLSSGSSWADWRLRLGVAGREDAAAENRVCAAIWDFPRSCRAKDAMSKRAVSRVTIRAQ